MGRGEYRWEGGGEYRWGGGEYRWGGGGGETGALLWGSGKHGGGGYFQFIVIVIKVSIWIEYFARLR